MMKRLFLFCFATLALSACSSIFLNTSDKVKNVKIGMTEKQVISVMGNDYQIHGAWGNTRVLSYPVYHSDWIYKFFFVNNRLESFERIYILPHFPDHPHKSKN